MSGRQASVWLEDVRVGELVENDDRYVEFHPDRRWQESPGRPVLGQWFEDRPGKRQRGARPGDLPPFFANMIPEGDLGLILRDRLGIPADDDLGLLVATAPDLPGAIVVRAESDFAFPFAVEPAESSSSARSPLLRFSLAGVQLKFSMLRSGDRFVFPASGERGDVLVKVDPGAFPGLCRNEYLTMEWARCAGFDVPKCELRRLGELVDVPREGDPGEPVFVIERYDRAGKTRIHQEDLMQVLGFPCWPSERKYNDATYDQLAALLTEIVGPATFDEVVRRLAFVVASGNNDAHLKNWSIMYPDRLNAVLTPLYDQVFSGEWPGLDHELALNLGGAKPFAQIDVRRFRELAQRCGRNPDHAADLVTATISRIAAAWAVVADTEEIGGPFRQALQRHWASVPLLAPHALLVA